MKHPSSILDSPDCKAQILSISDQHVSVQLTHKTKDGNEEKDVQSLLKLNLIPFHRRLLASTTEDEERNATILDLLNEYEFKLMSESGAEYSFYEATRKQQGILSKIFGLKRQRLDDNIVLGDLNAELISPASDRQINRCKLSLRSLISESPDLYNAVTKPFIETQLSKLSWLENIINGTKEKERLLYDSNSWLLNIDTKWRSHPDPCKVPKEEWLNHGSTADLYCLGIIKHNGVATIRDLKKDEHMPILKDMLIQGPTIIKKLYGVESDQLRIFVHYQPQFYHFHVHFTRLENEFGCQVERGHLLTDIIQNLELDSEYYAKKTLTYVLRVTDDLYKRIDTYQNKPQQEEIEEKCECECNNETQTNEEDEKQLNEQK